MPEASTATAVAMSVLLLPKLLAHTKFPDESNFDTKASFRPADVRFAVPTPGLKSVVSRKYPAV